MPENKEIRIKEDANTKPANFDEEKIIDPFMIYDIDDVFDFNQRPSKVPSSPAKMEGSAYRYPESDAEIIPIAEFLQHHKLGYYRKTISDYPISYKRIVIQVLNGAHQRET